MFIIYEKFHHTKMPHYGPLLITLRLCSVLEKIEGKCKGKKIERKIIIIIIINNK